MEPVLVVLSVFGCVFLAFLTVERGILIWQGVTPSVRGSAALEADHVELKAYAHGEIHRLRDVVHNVQLKAETTAAVFMERFARLETKTDMQTVTLDKLLSIVEGALLKQKETA